MPEGFPFGSGPPGFSQSILPCASVLKNSAPLFYGLAVMALPLFAVHAAEETNSARAEIAPKVAAARAILEPWLAENPAPARKKVHLVLWTPMSARRSARR